MQHSSTSTHRSIKSSGVLKAKKNRGNIDKNNSTPTKSRTTSSSRTSTPVSTFGKKLNLWKKKRAAATSTVIDKKTDGLNSEGNSKARVMYPDVDHRTGRRSERTKPAPAPDRRYSSRNLERSISSSGNRKEARAVDYSESMYNQVVDGLKKMRSSSSDDHTVVTDGSTVVSEMTTDTSYAFHTFKVDKHKFTVDKRYSMLRTVGSGAYGVVISAKDFVGGNNVAIKMVPKAFNDEIDAKRILREIKLLKHFHHENIISIQDMMPPLARTLEDFRDVYIVTDLMETDLHRIIYSKQTLSIDHVQYFMYQMLRAVKYIHSANVLHRDLKPSNLLVNSNCDLKVCDFGLARGISPTHNEDLEDDGRNSVLLTEYVVTRWYRAPEIMLACHEYSKPIDLWSVGCIFAELLGRKPFLAGDDYIDQLTLITQKLGKLSERDMDFITSSKAKNFFRKLPNKEPVPLSRQFPRAPPVAIELLSNLLEIHPRKRINVTDALNHPFFASLHNADDEPVAHASFDFTFEDEKLNRVRLQELIWEEVGAFRPSCLPVPNRLNGTSGVHPQRLYHA